MAVINNSEVFADKFRIESTRLSNWNYSRPGLYFITICTQNKNNFLGKIINEKIELSKSGEIVKQELLKTFEIRKNIKLDEWVIMPNHIHLIIEIPNPTVETHCVRLYPIPNIVERDAHSASLQKKMTEKSIQIIPNIIKLFKASVKSKINQQHLFFSWQTRYYDRIIRNEKEFFAIKQYIQNNPKNWLKDKIYNNSFPV